MVVAEDSCKCLTIDASVSVVAAYYVKTRAMNLILFEKPFESVQLHARDKRALHLRKVLHARVGSLVYVGFVNSLRAHTEVVAVSPEGAYELKVISTEPAPELLPIHLLIGLPRPHAARHILFEAASLGVSSLHFFQAEKSEPSYAKSRLWQTDEWRDRTLRGTEQAFGTHLPQVERYSDMQSAMEAQTGSSIKIALDNYEASDSLNAISLGEYDAVTIAIGPERGWSADERVVFRKNEWLLAHMGPHVMRTATACVAATAALASKFDFWRRQSRQDCEF